MSESAPTSKRPRHGQGKAHFFVPARAGIPLLLVLLLIAGALIWAQQTIADPSERFQETQETFLTPVTSRTLGCPALIGGEDVPGATSRVAAGFLPEAETDESGSVDSEQVETSDDPASPLFQGAVLRLVTEAKADDDLEAKDLLILTKPGESGSIKRTKSAMPETALYATGSQAGLVAATAWQRVTKGDLRHLGAAVCSVPTQRAYFSGFGTYIGRTSTLQLANPSSGPAQVDVRVLSNEGPIFGEALSGINIPPGGKKVIDLNEAAPGQKSLGLTVTARQGLVQAQVFESTMDGSNPVGASFAPQAHAGKRVAIPYVPGGSGARTLSLFPTGSEDATVQIYALRSDGAYVPVGLEEIIVPAENVTSVDVRQAVKEDARSFLVVSDRNVVAGVRSAVTTKHAPKKADPYRYTDVTLSAGAMRIDETSAIMGVMPGLVAPRVWLANPAKKRPAKVLVRTMSMGDDPKELDAIEVDLEPESAQNVALEIPENTAVTVVVDVLPHTGTSEESTDEEEEETGSVVAGLSRAVLVKGTALLTTPLFEPMQQQIEIDPVYPDQGAILE